MKDDIGATVPFTYVLKSCTYIIYGVQKFALDLDHYLYTNKSRGNNKYYY